MKNLLLLFILCSTQNLICQFSTLKEKPGKNLIHNCIAKSKASSNFYVVASTIHDEEKEEYDINLAKLNSSGVTLWERELNLKKDDRVLDVMVDVNDDIILTGYTGTENIKQLYIAKYNSAGSLINDLILKSTHSTIGTKIIESEFSDNYFIGGFTYSTEKPYDMGSSALLISVDSKLEHLNWETEYKRSGINNTITEILELPNENLFITGSLGQDVTGQLVLAAFVDPNSAGSVTPNGNLSFELTQDHCLGASAVYDDANDEIWLLLNAGDDGKPHFIGIKKATSEEPILNETGRLLDINNTPIDKYAAFKIMLSPANADGLTIFGYKDHAARYNSGFGMWAIDVHKNNARIMGGLKLWNPSGPTLNLEFQGGGVLSLFSNASNTGMPYFHTPSIAVKSHDGSRFVALTMDDVSGNTEVGVLSFNNNLLYASSPCLKFLDPVNETFTTYPKEIYENSNFHFIESSEVTPFVASIYGLSYCSINSITTTRNSVGSNEVEDESALFGNAKLDLYPNPTSGDITLKVKGGDGFSELKLINELGQIVMEVSSQELTSRMTLDVSKLETGVYNLIAKGVGENIMHERIVKL